MRKSSTAIAILAMAALSSRPAPGADAAPGCLTLCPDAASNYAIKECLATELKAAEAELERYLQASRDQWRFEQDTDPDPEAARAMDELSKAIPERLEQAQTAWREYLDADCSAVGAIWTNGSGRGAAVLDCQIVRVRRRSLDLWAHYLRLGTELPEPRQPCEP